MDETKEQESVDTKDSNSKCRTNPYKDQAEEKLCRGPKLKEIPPDGGWGWMIVVGGFISMGLVSLSLAGYGILFSPLLMTLGISSAKVAWIFSLYGLTWNTSIILLGPLCQEFGCRKVAIAGGICSFLSLFSSVFAKNANFLFFTFSVLGGLGGSIGTVVCQFVGSHYFEKQRGFALAVMTLGMGIGSSITPLFANFLLYEYGYKGATLIYSGIVLNQCVTGALFEPVKKHLKRVQNCDVADCDDDKASEVDLPVSKYEIEEGRNVRRLDSHDSKTSASYANSVGVIIPLSSLHDSSFVKNQTSNLSTKDEVKTPETKKSLRSFFPRIFMSTVENLKLLRFWRVIIISIGSGCVILGYVNFQMWIPFAVIEAGHSMQAAAWCVSSANIANILSRMTMSFLSDKPLFCVKKGYITGTLCVGIFIIGFALTEDITFLLILSCCWGFSVGTCMSLYSLVIIKIMGVKLFPGVLGIASLTNAAFIITIGPAIGAIRDATSSYCYSLLTMGALEFIAFGLWMTLPIATKHDKKLELQDIVRKNEENP